VTIDAATIALLVEHALAPARRIATVVEEPRLALAAPEMRATTVSAQNRTTIAN